LQIISDDLNTVTFQLLMRVKVLQLADSPAVAHLLGKRYFCSLKEVSKVVHCAKALIIAPDVRPSPTAHIKPVGLLQSVIRTAQAMGVPYVFALSRRGIGQVFGRDKNMSIVAVMQTDGVEAEFVQMLEMAGRVSSL
jgi:ribosomal protein L7Ae-like RNA K-turn-binding protein